MTLTAPSSSSSAVDVAVFGIDPGADWISTPDHRRIGQLHVGLVLIMAAAAAVVGVVVHGAVGDLFTLSASGRSSIVALLGAHENAWGVLIGLPLWIAVGSLVVPGQIGAPRMAFPRMQSLSLWGWVVGATTFVSAYLVQDGPPAFLVTSSSPLTANGTVANKATDLLLASLILVSLATLAGAVNLLVTIVTERRSGLAFGDMRPFSWSVFVTSAVMLIAIPPFVAGLFLVYLDQHFGGTLFSSEGSQLVWVHMVWMWGRPEALLIALPAVGMVADVVVSRTGRPVVGGPVVNWLILAAGVLSLGIWTGGSSIASAAVVPTSRWVTGLVLVPLGLVLLLVLGSLRGGLKPGPSLLYVLGVIVALGAGAILIAVAAARTVSGDGIQFFQFGVTNLVVFGAALLGATGVLVEHAKEGVGSALSKAGSGLAGLALIGGVLLSGIALAVGALVDSTATKQTFQTLNVVAAVGKALIAVGSLSFAAALVGSVVLATRLNRRPVPAATIEGVA